VKVISSTVNGFVVFIIIYAAYVMYEVKYSSQMSYVSNYLYSVRLEGLLDDAECDLLAIAKFLVSSFLQKFTGCCLHNGVAYILGCLQLWTKQEGIAYSMFCSWENTTVSSMC